MPTHPPAVLPVCRFVSRASNTREPGIFAWAGLGDPFPEFGPPYATALSLDQAMPRPLRPTDGPTDDASDGKTGPDEGPFQLDLLRGDLYRLLDELVRARSESRGRLVLEFERAWEEFKNATGRSASPEPR